MSLNAWLFLVTSLLVVLDFGLAGVYLWRIGRAAIATERVFILGLARLLLTVAAFNLFWLILVAAGPYLRLSENPLLRHLATSLIVAIDLAAVIGRRRWWRQIIPAVNGHNSSIKGVMDEAEER